MTITKYVLLGDTKILSLCPFTNQLFTSEFRYNLFGDKELFCNRCGKILMTYMDVTTFGVQHGITSQDWFIKQPQSKIKRIKK